MLTTDPEKKALLDELAATEEARREWIRTAVLAHGRLDVLCEEVLGLKLRPFHRAMQRFALRNPASLQLAFRGAGKSTTITVALTVFHVLRNPNIRILLASKTHEFAKDILKEIKGHFESEILTEIFGDHVGPRWDTREIVVSTRTKVQKEATVSTVGAEGQVVGKHYDVIFVDDLVDQKNSQTSYMREQVKTFYYKTLLPTLEPDGEIHVLGTRYHYADLYGHLQREEFTSSTQIVPVLDGDGKTPWPEKFPTSVLRKRKRAMGLVIFITQMQCDAEQMRGEVFEVDFMPEVPLDEVPADAVYYLGVDVSTGEADDFFAMVAIAASGSKIWVVDHFERKIRFGEQARKIAEWYDRFQPAKVGIETNAYQVVLAQALEDKRPDITVRKINTKLSKQERAIKLAARHEEGEISYVYGNQALISHLVLFPRGENDDLFDALDHAIKAAFGGRGRRGRRGRSRRNQPVGLL